MSKEAEILKAVRPFQEGRIKEIKEVRELGERIGYGNMMSIASALWRISLEDKWGITTGAFIPTIASFMKKKEATKATNEQKHRADAFRELLK